MKPGNSVLFLLIALLFSFTSACSKGSSSGGSGAGSGGNNGNPTPAWDPHAMRGVWVTTTASTALDSRNQIRDCVQACKAAGINTIFVVVYNNAATLYPSQVMQNLTGTAQMTKYAGRDPLQEMIEEGHAAGLKVMAWFEYGFSSSYSANGGPIVAAKPNWAALDINGNLVVKNGFDWLNAFDPEVQGFILDLVKEVVTHYEVDGIQGDDRLPALPSTAGYDPYTVNLYKSENGGADPPADYRDANWIKWRTNKLNQFMKKLYTEVKSIKPGILVTESPSPFPWGMSEYLQDWPTWVDSGWVDAVLPQCYRYDITNYNATLSQQKSYYRNSSIPFYPGILLKSGSYVASPSFLSQMVQSNRNSGFKGESFFFYEGIPATSNWFQGQYPYIK